MAKAYEKYRKDIVAHNTIQHILDCNQEVEKELSSKTKSGSFTEATISHFLELRPAAKLQDFVHVRKFNGPSFQQAKLVGADGKLNKTRYRCQTAESIEAECHTEHLFLIWLA